MMNNGITQKKILCYIARRGRTNINKLVKKKKKKKRKSHTGNSTRVYDRIKRAV